MKNMGTAVTSKTYIPHAKGYELYLPVRCTQTGSRDRQTQTGGIAPFGCNIVATQDVT